ncbi:hypothetical protein Tco_0341082 [Tanacetum coccineum]
MATPPEKAKALDYDLRKPSREMLKSPLSGRIIEFSSPKHKMPSNVNIYDGSTDPDDHINRFTGARNQEGWLMQVWYRIFQRTLDDATMGWFDRLSASCIDDSTELHKKSITRVPQMVDGMMRKVDDFVRSEEASNNETISRICTLNGVVHHLHATEMTISKNPYWGEDRRIANHRTTYCPREYHAPYVAFKNDFRRNDNLKIMGTG